MLGTQLALGTNYKKQLGAADSLEPKASQLFERVFNPSNGRGLWALFTKAITPMPIFDEIYAEARLTGQHYQGMRPIKVSSIIGTLDRNTDFDAAFRPTQRHSENRWLRVATAMLRGVELPPIQLIQVEEAYYVKDGHHRVSVARALDFGYLDAEIIVYAYETA